MISILIVDDDPNKIHNISQCLLTNPAISKDNIFTLTDAVGARAALEDKVFDLLILDLRLPERFGFDFDSLGGVDLYHEIINATRLNKPTSIVALTSFDELHKNYSDEFSKDVNFVLKYDPFQNDWCEKLQNQVKYLIDLKQNNYKVVPEYVYDIAIVTALHTPELKAVLELPVEWTSLNIAGDHTRYYISNFVKEEKSLKVVAASADHMGMAAAGSLSTKIIYTFRPKYIVMLGIAAAVDTDANYGDILVASTTFDYGSGKLINDQNKDRIFLPDPQQIQMDRKLCEYFKYAKMNSLFVDSIKRKWPAAKPQTSLEVHIDSIASGSAVVQDEKVIKELKSHARKVIGIDMETYAVYYAAMHAPEPRPIPMSIKSASDFADLNKSDEYQLYCTFTSANYFYQFALQFLQR